MGKIQGKHFGRVLEQIREIMTFTVIELSKCVRVPSKVFMIYSCTKDNKGNGNKTEIEINE